MLIRHLAGTAIVFAVACAGISAGAAAPADLNGPASVGRLAAAVRLDPPEPALPPMFVAVLLRVNTERARRGLGPMIWDDRLGLAAMRHSVDQAAIGMMTHSGRDGSTIADRIDRVGFPWTSGAENVGVGYLDAESVMAAWMASVGHRRIILSANTHIGVGLAYGADGRPYWTQVYATLR